MKNPFKKKVLPSYKYKIVSEINQIYFVFFSEILMNGLPN